jgi:hypothetical protein
MESAPPASDSNAQQNIFDALFFVHFSNFCSIVSLDPFPECEQNMELITSLFCNCVI